MLGASAAVLLVIGGEAALTVLQVSSLAGAAPLSIVYVLAMVALGRALLHDAAELPRYVRIRPYASSAALVSSLRQDTDDDEELKKKLGRVLRHREKAREHLSPALSMSFAGLSADVGSPSGRSAAEDGEAPRVMAIHEVPAHAITVDTRDGTIRVDEEHDASAPIPDEVFDTPEYRESTEGTLKESEELVATHLEQAGAEQGRN